MRTLGLKPMSLLAPNQLQKWAAKNFWLHNFIQQELSVFSDLYLIHKLFIACLSSFFGVFFLTAPRFHSFGAQSQRSHGCPIPEILKIMPWQPTGRCLCLWQRGLSWMAFKVPFNPNYSMILWVAINDCYT